VSLQEHLENNPGTAEFLLHLGNPSNGRAPNPRFASHSARSFRRKLVEARPDLFTGLATDVLTEYFYYTGTQDSPGFPKASTKFISVAKRTRDVRAGALRAFLKGEAGPAVKSFKALAKSSKRPPSRSLVLCLRKKLNV